MKIRIQGWLATKLPWTHIRMPSEDREKKYLRRKLCDAYFENRDAEQAKFAADRRAATANSELGCWLVICKNANVRTDTPGLSESIREKKSA